MTSAGSVQALRSLRMKEYYEELWEELPEDLSPPDLGIRREFLRRQLRPGDRVLDLGFGSGVFTDELARTGVSVVGIEVAQVAVRRAQARHPRLDFRLAPLDGPLPLQDGSFDLVWASEVIEHVADTARWLSEARRVLVPAGRLLVTTPSHGRLRIALGGIERYSEPLGDHLHLYTRASLRRLLQEFGFGAVSVRSAGGPPLLRRMLLGRGVR
jgi:SAM-dependent methyltransferase